MRQILVIGAGKSTSVLISYLIKNSEKENIFITVADKDEAQAKRISGNHPRTKALALDIFNAESRKTALQNADLVISMLPARFHIEVARDCVRFREKPGYRLLC
jgi:saccharopine dehydrogenase-like NADP-dependent oxidoreductase